MKKQYITFVLAAYNEELNVLPLTKRIVKSMKPITKNYEILYAIEGNDNTLAILKDYKRKNPKVKMKLIYQKKALGLTGALLKGFENVSKKTTHIITMDVDQNHKPEEVNRLIEESKKGYDLVIGSRTIKNSKIHSVPVWKRSLSLFANFVFRLLFGLKVSDKTNLYRMTKIETIREVAPLVKARGFEGLMEFLLIANRKGKRIKEVPTTFIFRTQGESKANVYRAGKGYLRLLLRRNEIMKF